MTVEAVAQTNVEYNSLQPPTGDLDGKKVEDISASQSIFETAKSYFPTIKK